MKHSCHAVGCSREVPPRMLMCFKHWKMVPKQAQDDIWRTYVPGQEIRKNPTQDYMKAQQRAVAMVLMKERGISVEAAVRIVLSDEPEGDAK